MNSDLKFILDLVNKSDALTAEETDSITDAIKSVDKELTIVEFKLERTEKVKRTTSILLEETIEELEQKRKVVEDLALESTRQASLDRIRAEIASMRSAEDLQQISPLLWQELNNLEVPFIRCGVFIMDEENEIIHTYLSTPLGKSIAVLNLPFKGMPLIENAVKAWRNQQIFTEHWDEDDFNKWTENLIKQGFIQSKEKYEAGSAPETLELHFLPFKQGMLYIGNTEPLSEESLNLGQSLADAFSVAYDRYEDFNKLEIAKQKVETTLKELRATQQQLVQQEKLASLGQLTAGIAHEIKNPLNFVNNFSDLSIELLEEARDEIKRVKAEGRSVKDSFDLYAEASAQEGGGKDNEAGQHDNYKLILDILDDIETNLKTIHKHGTRADGIVRSMLQHSRGGSGKMEPTEINPLLKEFTNLSYHGMRAGEKPFDVEIDFDLDLTIGEIPLISEDFSRVIVNLCNNAFDAMRKKMKDNGEHYSPKLYLRTIRSDSLIKIIIEDNGTGIPKKLRKKILQPFFTTKQGTEGTGLGLYITNDIIRAHGGTLTILSEENKFTRFNIELNAKR